MIDLHIHLYGALTVESLWQLAREEMPHWDPARIAWYKAEYAKNNGRSSRFDDFFTSNDGLELFKSEYTLDATKIGFAKFQAAINLPIALFPLSPDHDNLILKQALNDDQAGGFLRHVEYRVFLPPYFNDEQCCSYLSRIARQVHTATTGSYTPKLAMSLPRAEPDRSRLYQCLRLWQRQNPDLAPNITGVDFCASERGQPPSLLRSFAQQLHADNASDPLCHLKLLVHVAETFEPATPLSMVRWVHQAAELGGDRLGHCVALATPPQALVGKSFCEKFTEYLDHLRWEIAHAAWLESVGYSVDLKYNQRLLRDLYSHDLTKEKVVVFDKSQVEKLSQLQHAVKSYLETSNVVIETCPTSNARINGIIGSENHPCQILLDDVRLKVVIGSDDPGIFQTDLKREIDFCKKIGITDDALSRASLVAAEQILD